MVFQSSKAMNTSQFQLVMHDIDEANHEDPNHELADGQEYPREYLYSLRMSQQLNKLAPEADEVLQIAARAQHIRRWQIPRTDYPKTRTGYLTWRRDLGRFHAEETAAIMKAAGYDHSAIERLEKMLVKKGIKQNPHTQTLEDVICLVFLQYYLEPFATKHDEAKLISIVQKTWAKMSPQGQEAALQLSLPTHLGALINKALSASL